MSTSGKPGDGSKTTAGRVLGKEPMRAPPPKRFYKSVEVAQQSQPGGEIGYAILLDGRPVKTPRKKQLCVPSRTLADAIAAEWTAADKVIDPAIMPFTRMTNTAIDAVSEAQEAVADDIVSFAGSDLLCYRAADDERLAQRQAAHWNSLIGWAASRLDARFAVTKGVMPVDQSRAALDAVAAALAGFNALELTALHVMTTLTGSAILTLAHALGAVTAGEAWTAAHVDEDFQAGLWGVDEEAEARRAKRWTEFQAASRLLHFARP